MGIRPHSRQSTLFTVLTCLATQEAHVTNQTGLVANWSPGSSLSMAASCGSLVAVAHSNRVSLLSIDPFAGQLSSHDKVHFDSCAATQEVRVTNSTGLVANWTPGSSLSMAASCGSLVALAHGDRVSLLDIDPSDGQPSLQQTAHFDQQASAVALLDVSQGMQQVRAVHDSVMDLLCCLCDDLLGHFQKGAHVC